MAKSIRSKRMKRLRTLKRQQYMRVEGNQKLANLAAFQRNPQPIRQAPNMFLYPNNPNAQVPQHKTRKIIDYRSDSIPNYGFSAVGVMRQPERIQKCCGVVTRTLREQQQVQQQQQFEQIKQLRCRKEQKENELNIMLDNLQLGQHETSVVNRPLIRDVVMEDRVNKIISKRKKTKRGVKRIPCKNSRKKITSFKYKP